MVALARLAVPSTSKNLRPTAISNFFSDTTLVFTETAPRFGQAQKSSIRLSPLSHSQRSAGQQYLLVAPDLDDGEFNSAVLPCHVAVELAPTKPLANWRVCRIGAVGKLLGLWHAGVCDGAG